MKKESLQNQADRAEALAAQTSDDELARPFSRPRGNTESSSRAWTTSCPIGSDAQGGFPETGTSRWLPPQHPRGTSPTSGNCQLRSARCRH